MTKDNRCENLDCFGRVPCVNAADMSCPVCGARLCFRCHESEPDCRYHSERKRVELRARFSSEIAE